MVLKNGEEVAVRLITFTGKDANKLLRYARIGRISVICTGVYYGLRIIDVLLDAATKRKTNNSTEHNGEEDES